MNHLQHETSPYLLQHAHNPVDWHAWKPAAFAKAKKENKPILVSIGYSTCHWCHVMERESFEDGEVAEFMNENFVCIKVDREERPDVDQIYMEACQVLTGAGGWPLNCFLTPDGKPFYAGTYYPPMPAHNRPSWLQVLMNLSHAYQNKRETVEEQATRLLEIIRNSGKNFTEKKLQVERDDSPFSEGLLNRIFQGLQRSFDTLNGGFGGAPKFPGTMSLHYLLDYHYFTGEMAALQHLELSLDKMARGGIYDHLGGGFARYATDTAWLVPHFEKMLYDNALLVSLYSVAYKVTKKELYKAAIEETLAWVEREMTSGEGGFFSAQDADSEGVEGKFYVWKKEKVEEVLGDGAPLFCKYYGVTEDGNWEGENILWRALSLEEFASAEKILPGALRVLLGGAGQRLFAERKKRIPPGLDDKILLDWNALMVSAFAKAYEAIGHEKYRETAVGNLRFLQKKLTQSDGLSMFHTYKGGKAQYDAFLDDYAYLIEAMVDVYEISFDTAHLLQADRYMAFVLENFLDEEGKMFYFTSAKQRDIPLRRKDLFDSATPSGNSTMVRNLQRMGILVGNESYRLLAIELLLTMRDSVAKYPTSFSRWATSLVSEVHGIPEIAVTGAEAEALAGKLAREFLPQRALMAGTAPDDIFPLLARKFASDDTLIYVCKNYTCRQPVKTIEAFKEKVREK